MQQLESKLSATVFTGYETLNQPAKSVGFADKRIQER